MTQNVDVVARKMFTIRFNEEELERLDLVAKHYALTSAGVLRMLVKREADAIAAAAPKPRRK
jgi:predicted DNA-binding protein